MPLPDAELTIVAAIVAPIFRVRSVPTVAGVAPPASLGIPDVIAWFRTLDDEQLREVLTPHTSNPHIARALGRLAPAPVPVTTPGPKRRRIVFGRPVVDRDDLARHLATMIGGRKRILYVRGESHVGKTYSRVVVQDEAQAIASPQVKHHYAEIDLVGAVKLEAVLEHVRSWLQPVTAMPTVVGNFSSVDSWARACAQHVFTTATAAPNHAWWLLFDHFDQSKPDISTIAFFARLVELVGTQPASESAMRLVLIDHSTPTPASARVQAAEDRVGLPSKKDIETFFRDTTPWADDEVSSKAGDVFAALEGMSKEEWMPTLELLLTAQLGELLA